MTVQGQARVWCSLGKLVSGLVGDEPIEGNWLISTKGTLVISGLINPAKNTIVRLAYGRQNIVVPFPRLLVVLSATPSPRERVTVVEVGDPVELLTNWATADAITAEEAASSWWTDLPAEARKYLAPTISAQSVVQKCATALGTTLAAGSYTIPGEYLVSQLSLSDGYVPNLKKVLESNTCYGFINQSGQLVVRKLDLAAPATGPLFTWETLSKLEPVNSGELPFDGVTVSSDAVVAPAGYPTTQTVNLADNNWAQALSDALSEAATGGGGAGGTTGPPISGVGIRQNTEQKQRALQDWTYEETRGSTITKSINVRLPGATADSTITASFQPFSFTVRQYTTLTTRDPSTGELGTADVDISSTTVNYSVVLVANPNLVKSYAENGVSINPNAVVATAGKTEKVYEIGPDGQPFTKQETQSEFIPWIAFAGGLGIEDYVLSGEVLSLPLLNVLNSQTITTNEPNQASGITKTTTARYLASGATAEGQQGAATQAKSANSVAELLSIIDEAAVLVFDGIEVRTTQSRDVQLRPSAQDFQQQRLGPRGGAAKADLAFTELDPFGTGQWAANTTVKADLTLPLAPDDYLRGDVSGSILTITLERGGAEDLAARYGEGINALRYAKRYGSSIAGDAWAFPQEPLASLFIEESGLTAGFRVNGLQWAISGDGIAVGCDALLCGGVARDGTITPQPWVPAIGALSSLPVRPSITTGTGLPANAITRPSGFDPDDLANSWDLLPSDQAASPAASISGGRPMKPYGLRRQLSAVTGSRAQILSASDFPDPVVTPLEAITVSAAIIEFPSFTSYEAIAGSAGTIYLPQPRLIGSPASTADLLIRRLQAISASVGTIQIGEVDLFFNDVLVLCGFNGPNLSTAFIDEGPLGLTLTAAGSPVISTAQSVYGGSSLFLDGSSSLRLPTDSRLVITNDLTIEVLGYFLDNRRGVFIGERSGSGRVERQDENSLGLFIGNSGIGASQSTPSGAWGAYAYERFGNKVSFYFQGNQILQAANSEFLGDFNLSAGEIGQFLGGLLPSRPKMYGYQQELRVTKRARFEGASSYTVRSSPFPRQ